MKAVTTKVDLATAWQVVRAPTSGAERQILAHLPSQLIQESHLRFEEHAILFGVYVCLIGGQELVGLSYPVFHYLGAPNALAYTLHSRQV